MKRFIISFIIILFLPCISFAHSGGTDDSGGHNSPTGYHYHHGHPAHSHSGGVCPYNYDDATEYHPSSTYPATTKQSKSFVTETEDSNFFSVAWDKISCALEPVVPPILVTFGIWYFANIFLGILSAFSPFDWLETPIKKSTEIWATIICTMLMLPFMLIGHIFLIPEYLRKAFRK